MQTNKLATKHAIALLNPAVIFHSRSDYPAFPLGRYMQIQLGYISRTRIFLSSMQNGSRAAQGIPPSRRAESPTALRALMNS